MHKIILIRTRRTYDTNINEKLQWFGQALGLFNLRDKDSSCFRIFITLVRAAKKRVMTSDEIAEMLHLSRGTVVHHLTRLMNSGIVVRESGGYILREENLEKVVQDIKHDISRFFDDLQGVAKEIDERLG